MIEHYVEQYYIKVESTGAFES